MELWQYGLLTLLAASLAALAVVSGVRRSRARKERDFTRRLETLLLPKETVQVICPDRKGRWVLTDRRLILETGDRFLAYPFARIRKVSGEDAAGKTTVAAGKMAVLLVKADHDHALRRKRPDFEPLVKGLKAGVAAARKKAK